MTSNSFSADSPSVLREIAGGVGISLAQAARLLPPSRSGRPVNPATVWRWALDGVRTTDGRRVRLEVARLGCRWLTSKAALERFLAAQQPQSDSLAPVPAPARRPEKASRRQAQIQHDIDELR